MCDSFAELWSSSAAIPPKTKPQTLASASLSSRATSKPDPFASSTKHSVTDVGAQDSAWLGLDSLGGSVDDWGLADFSATVAAPTTTIQTPLSHPQPKQSSLKPAKIWDLQDFASPSSSAHSSRPSSQPKIQQRSQISSNNFGPSVLNFGITIQDDHGAPRDGSSAEIGLLDLDDNAPDFNLAFVEQKGSLLDQSPVSDRADDDILGVLSQPVEVVKAQKLSPNISRQPSFDDPIPFTNKKSKLQSTSSSPPPHILGQIVEMGFSVEQAKKALANTRDGKDVRAALETLLGSSSETEVRREDSGHQPIVEEVQELPPVKRGPPKGFRERERERVERMRRERERDSNIPPGGSDVVSDMQEQADRLLSQASEIGLSVLSKASAFWKEKKEQVVKVYEERAATPGQKDRADGEPKWMKEGVFRDDDDDDDYPKVKERRIPRIPQERELTEPQQEVLFSILPVALPTRERPLPTASPFSLSTVDKHRTAGGSQFKLGQYASAIESYTAAINSLPPGHLLLLPLFNNRALARMRTGEYKAAAEDAVQALRIIVLVNDDRPGVSDEFEPNAKESTVEITTSSWHPSMEPSFLLVAAQQKSNSGGWTHPQGFGVDLVDGYVKALHRRAESSEGRERWSEALKSWELLTAGDSLVVKDHLRKSAQRSAARCRKMMTLDQSNETSKLKSNTPSTKPRPRPAAPPITSVAPTRTNVPSAALRSLRATNAQAEAEDNLKHQLKDSVDSKLAAWRAGKETNIRALLASLDMILWEGLLKGVRVGGLHELVTPAQVKKGYVKVIARVHPDKLNAQNSTVEQRMLANAVFGTLSEAWTSFQNTNGV